ncbi:hypothetical protein Hanom_Chr11g01042291 [Helianthus anomalus]
MKMVFRGKEEVATEAIQTPYSEAWYQDIKDVPSIALPEKALVGAAMSLCWRMNREDKSVYMEGDSIVSLYVVGFEREGGRMATVPKRADEELWYHQIVKNFVLPWDEDLSAQPATDAGELSNLVIGPEKKKRVPTATNVPRKNYAERAQSSKAKNVRLEKKGLASVVVKKPKAEPRDTTGIPPSNPDDPIDLESSPEPLLKTKAGKRKHTDTKADG